MDPAVTTIAAAVTVLGLAVIMLLWTVARGPEQEDGGRRAGRSRKLAVIGAIWTVTGIVAAALVGITPIEAPLFNVGLLLLGAGSVGMVVRSRSFSR